MLTVHNKNGFDFEGRYNGVDYSFPSNKITAVPDDAARHIFGVGLQDKTDVLVRHGWIKTSDGRAHATAILNKFSFNIADTLREGEITDPPCETVMEEEPEQGSAPLQLGSEGEEGATKVRPNKPSPPSKGGSILETLGSITGA